MFISPSMRFVSPGRHRRRSVGDSLPRVDDLIDYAPADRRLVLVEQRELLTHQVCQLSRDGRDLHRSTTPDGQGLGTGA